MAGQNRMIDPRLERAEARMMKTTALEFNSSHVSMVSNPKKVADFTVRATEKLASPQALNRC